MIPFFSPFAKEHHMPCCSCSFAFASNMHATSNARQRNNERVCVCERERDREKERERERVRVERKKESVCVWWRKKEKKKIVNTRLWSKSHYYSACLLARFWCSDFRDFCCDQIEKNENFLVGKKTGQSLLCQRLMSLKIYKPVFFPNHSFNPFSSSFCSIDRIGFQV